MRLSSDHTSVIVVVVVVVIIIIIIIIASRIRLLPVLSSRETVHPS
jgi:hypothetical protein